MSYFFKVPSKINKDRSINRKDFLKPKIGEKMTGQVTRVNSCLPGQVSRARYNKKSPDEYKRLVKREINVGSNMSPRPTVTVEDAPNLRP